MILILSIILGNFIPAVTLVGMWKVSGWKGMVAATVGGYLVTTFAIILPSTMLSGGIPDVILGKVGWDTINNLAVWLVIGFLTARSKVL